MVLLRESTVDDECSPPVPCCPMVLCQLLIFGNRKRRIENICILGIWPGEGFYVKYYYILFLVFYIVLCLYIFHIYFRKYV